MHTRRHVGDSIPGVALSADAVFVVDQDSRVVEWNEPAERFLGYSASAVLGRPCYAVLAGRDVFDNCFCRTSCTLQAMVRDSEPIHTFELCLRVANGLQRRASVSAVAHRDPSGRAHRIVHLLRPLDNGHGDEASRSALFRGCSRARLDAGLSRLTVRECEILQRLARGERAREIASTLYISFPTVRNHIHNILKKLGVHSRIEAVALFYRHAWSDVRARPNPDTPES